LPQEQNLKSIEIKTIVFDLGGVYFTSGTQLTLSKLNERYQINNWGALGRFFSSDPKKPGGLLRLGDISMEEFERRFYRKFDIKEKDPTILRQIWFANYVPYHNIPAIVEKLHEDYRLIVFSGNIKERVEFLDDRYDFLKWFEDSVFSYDYACNKSEKAFYEELIKHLECEPSEALLIDDKYETIQIAERFEIQTVLFSFTEQLVEDLHLYGIKL
jgi:FMN phosphatase YigB (HAD superfamily)